MSGLVTGYELNSTFYPPLSRLVTGGHGMSQHVTGKAVTKGVLHISEHNCKHSFIRYKHSFNFKDFSKLIIYFIFYYIFIHSFIHRKRDQEFVKSNEKIQTRV